MDDTDDDSIARLRNWRMQMNSILMRLELAVPFTVDHPTLKRALSCLTAFVVVSDVGLLGRDIETERLETPLYQLVARVIIGARGRRVRA